MSASARRLPGRAALAGLFLGLTALPAAAAVPTEPAKTAAAVGRPVALLVQPEAITLSGPRARQQVVVTGRYKDGSLRDLTALCELACDANGLIVVEEGGYLAPRKNGASALVVKAG